MSRSHSSDLMKHLFISAFVALGCAGWTVAVSADEPASRELVAAWSFDATGDAIAKDTSRYGHDGILRGAVPAAGKAGGGIECHQDALVEVPHTAVLDDFKSGISVTAWVNRSADTAWNTVMSREVKDGASEYFGLAVVKNKALFSVDPDGAHYQNIKSDEDVPTSEWIHLAGTYDNAMFRLYVNGRLVKSAPCTIPFNLKKA